MLIAVFCGWCRFSAIFSGRMCTSQKMAIATIGITIRINSASQSAAVSMTSGGRNDAWALQAARSAAASVARKACIEMVLFIFRPAVPG